MPKIEPSQLFKKRLKEINEKKYSSFSKIKEAIHVGETVEQFLKRGGKLKRFDSEGNEIK